MRKLLATLLILASTALADDTIPFKTLDGKAKTSASGIGTVSKPYDFSNVTVTGISGGGGGGTPGGLTGQLQYKFSSSAFGGIPELSYNSVVDLLTLQAGSKLSIVDPTDTTKKIVLTLSGISSGTLRNVSVPNADSTFVIPNTVASGLYVTGISTSGAVTTGTVSDAVLSTSDITTNNTSITKHGFAPKLPNDVSKYLDGTGAFSVPPGGTGTPGGSAQQIQYNNTTFGGIPFFLFDPAANGGLGQLTLQTGNKFRIRDTTDTTKQAQFDLSGLTTGIVRTTTVPNGNNVWVIADAGAANNFLTGITTGGVITKAQVLFPNLGGTISQAQQNIPVGKTLYVDAVNGNNTTALTNRFDKPYLTLTGANGAISATAAGDQIIITPGTYNEGTAVVLPQNIAITGSGAGVTTVVTTGGMKPGTGDKISDMTIDARTGTNSTFSFPLGADSGDTAFTDVTIAGVQLLGNTDGFYFNKAGIDRVAMYDCQVITTFDPVFTGNMTGTIDFYNTTFISDGSIGGAAVCIGINDTKGTVNLYGGSITVSNGVLEARGAQSDNAGAVVNAHNVTFNVSATTKFDLVTGLGGAVTSNDQNVRSDRAALATSGTIAQYVNTYEGNIGLTDITTNNSSISRHGFAPKLPNDVTKYYDGTGAFSVPPGSGGGGGSITIQNVGDADATIAASTNVVNLTAAYTGSHILTLPAASGFATSPALVIIDPKKVLSSTFTVSVARAGSDTINGGTGNVVLMGVNETGGAATLYSDGSAKWTTAARGGASRVTGYIDGTVTTAGDVLTLSGGHWVGVAPASVSISDTAFAVSWDAVTGIGASKNALYDYFHIMSPSDNGKIKLFDQGAGIPVTDSTGLITSTKTAPSGTIVGTTDSQTISVKRITQRVTSNATVTNPTPSATTDDVYELTAQAGTAAFQVIAGTPTNGQLIYLRVKDDGTSRTLTFDAIYDFGFQTQPTATTVGTWTTLTFQYSTTATKWVCISAGTVPSISDTAFASSWNGVTTSAPSKNAVYDWGHSFDTDDDGKVNVLDQVAGITNTDASGVIQAPITAPTGAIVGTTDTQTLTNKQMTTIELGNASDTTLSRGFAGVMLIEGNTVPTIVSTNTFTNKRITPRVTSIASSATPTINTDNCDAVTITAQSVAITSMTTNLSGTPTDFDKLLIRIKDNGTARAITWGASFVSSGATLPTTTVLSKVTTVGLIWDAVKSKWVCIATDQEP
jgi:hypothetical protein